MAETDNVAETPTESTQQGRQTEAETETRRGAGRENDLMREREPETENMAETAKEI